MKRNNINCTIFKYSRLKKEIMTIHERERERNEKFLPALLIKGRFYIDRAIKRRNKKFFYLSTPHRKSAWQ